MKDAIARVQKGKKEKLVGKSQKKERDSKSEHKEKRDGKSGQKREKCDIKSRKLALPAGVAVYQSID